MSKKKNDLMTDPLQPISRTSKHLHIHKSVDSNFNERLHLEGVGLSDDGVSILTLEAMADEDMIAFMAVDGMTAWSLEVLVEIKPKFTECQGHSHEEARLERWTSVGYAGQV